MKICTKCKVEKFKSDFSPDKRTKDGLFSYCKQCNSARIKERYWKNLEESRKKNRNRDAQNREKSRAKCKTFWQTKRQEDPAYCLWAGAKARASRKKIPFDILREEIIIPEYCPVLGIKLKLDNTSGFKEDSPSIDKTIPELGYVRGNIQVMSWKANRLKNNGTLEEFKSLVRYLEELNAAESKRPLRS